VQVSRLVALSEIETIALLRAAIDQRSKIAPRDPAISMNAVGTRFDGVTKAAVADFPRSCMTFVSAVQYFNC
jgi:hypothetical protein